MSGNAHSVTFEMVRRPMADLVDVARKAFRSATDLMPAGEYTLTKWTDDYREGKIVAWKKGLSREAIPVVQDAPSSYNEASFPFYVDTPSGRVEGANFSVISYPSGLFSHLVFMGDVLESLGARWVLKTLGAILPGLGFESAILTDRSEGGDTETSNRVIAGEPLTKIIAARVRGEDPLPPPLLAFVKAELCDDDLWNVARDRGVDVRMTTKGFVVFSTVDL